MQFVYARIISIVNRLHSNYSLISKGSNFSLKLSYFVLQIVQVLLRLVGYSIEKSLSNFHTLLVHSFWFEQAPRPSQTPS